MSWGRLYWRGTLIRAWHVSLRTGCFTKEEGSGHMQITNDLMEMAYLKMRSVSPAIRYDKSLSLASFPGRVGGEKTSSLPRGLGMRLHYPRPSYPRVFDKR